MANIKILDCTLRDGGYVNEWKFSKKQTIDTIDGLIKSGVDIIECGFLNKNMDVSEWETRFSDLEMLSRVLSQFRKKQEQLFVAMINLGEFDIDTLPSPQETKLDGLRLAFHRQKMDEALRDMRKIAQKGYKLFVQPMTTNAYSNDELSYLFEELANIKPYAVYIVDTQGAMYDTDIKRLFDIFCLNLNWDICIGFHSHNNLQLSYANSIEFCNLAKLNQRNVIVDSSIYGMGRGAGNLHTELFVDFLNRRYEKKYNVNEILSLIDCYYYALYKEFGWGYSIYHYLSASYGCHPNYASFLFNKKHLLMQDIRQILSIIRDDKKNEFDKTYIEELYYSYNLKKSQNNRMPLLPNNKKILLLGSGKKILEQIDEIKKNRDKYFVVAMNYVPEELEVDYVFFTSTKRYSTFSTKINQEKVIFSSNIANEKDLYVLDYGSHARIDGLGYCDISIVMFINYLISLKASTLFLAGIDGFDLTNIHTNYCYDEKDYIADFDAIQKINHDLLYFFAQASKKIKIIFITESIFANTTKIEDH